PGCAPNFYPPFLWDCSFRLPEMHPALKKRSGSAAPETGSGWLPWTFIPDVPSERVDDLCFKTESFCSLFAETALEADTPAAFLDRAAGFANDILWGTLSASIIIHPASAHAPETAAALERAVAYLRHGILSVNFSNNYAYYF